MKPLLATDRTRQLVGRTTEMERIRKALTDSETHCRVFMIEGPGGLGKTRILEDVLHRLGQIAFTRFRRGTYSLAIEHISLPQRERWERVRKNDELQTYLKRAAESYTLSLAYAQLFAPGSSALTAAYDVLYDYLKKLNALEMVDFYRYEREFRKAYRVTKLKLENFGDLEEFLLDCFGDYYDPVEVDTAVSKENL